MIMHVYVTYMYIIVGYLYDYISSNCTVYHKFWNQFQISHFSKSSALGSANSILEWAPMPSGCGSAESLESQPRTEQEGHFCVVVKFFLLFLYMTCFSQLPVATKCLQMGNIKRVWHHSHLSLAWRLGSSLKATADILSGRTSLKKNNPPLFSTPAI